MGKKAEEVLGKSIWEIFPDSRNTPFYESCEKAKKNQQYQFLELFYPQFSRWFEIHIYPSITGLSIYFRDITKKKIIRERIIEAEKQYRHIFENALHGIFRSTPDWKLMTVNNYMAGLFGFSNPLEMVKSTQHLIRDLVPDPEKQAELEKLLKKDRFINAFELEMKGKNKPSSWVLLNINPIKDDSGKLTYYEGTIQDISAMKLATEQIRKEKEFSDSIINSLPGVFYLFTKEGSFLRWNKNFEIISGYNSQEVKNMHPSEFFEEKDRAYIQEKIEQVFEKGMVEVQASFFTKQQNKIPFYFNGWSTNIDGQPCLIGMGIDITDQRKSEMQLQEQNEELQQRNQELDHFVYSVSHDLRAPISSIKGILNIVNYEDIGNEVIQMCWEKIGLSINRLDNFISEVLDYSSNLRLH